MHGIHKVNVVPGDREPSESAGDAPQPKAQILVAVGRHQDDPLVLGQLIQGRADRIEAQAADVFQRIDSGVAGQEHVGFRDALPEQVGGGPGSRRKMQIGQHSGDAPVDLLRIRSVLVEGPQAGLDMPEANSGIESRHRGRHGRGRVALDEDPVG
jgi:hypothetical protein